MAVDRCDIGDMPKSWCAHCRGVTLPDDKPSTAFIARYPHVCPVCDARIFVGDSVVRIPGIDHASIVCEGCAAD
jgi:hypothetical protein